MKWQLPAAQLCNLGSFVLHHKRGTLWYCKLGIPTTSELCEANAGFRLLLHYVLDEDAGNGNSALRPSRSIYSVESARYRAHICLHNSPRGTGGNLENKCCTPICLGPSIYVTCLCRLETYHFPCGDAASLLGDAASRGRVHRVPQIAMKLLALLRRSQLLARGWSVSAWTESWRV